MSNRIAAKAALKYPPVRLNGLQARAVGRGFATIVERLDLRVCACAILPDHVHLVLNKHPEQVESLIGHLKRAASRRLGAEKIHPLDEYRSANKSAPSIWVAGGWKRYLNSWSEVGDAEDYVERNPLRAGFKKQVWGFVIPLR